MFRRNRKTCILVLGFVFMIIFLIGSSPVIQPDYSHTPDTSSASMTLSDGEPWLEEFPYRKYHIISGASNAGTNYQVEIRVRSGSGTDSGNLVHVSSSHWSVTDPVRFTDDDGVTLLDYWKESIDVNTATYWVEVKDSLDNDVLIYLYYGNATASSLSNGSATFLAWDDFDTGYTTGESPKPSRGWFLKNKGAGDIAITATSPAGGSGDALKHYNDGLTDVFKVGNTWGTVVDEVIVGFDFYWDTQVDGWLFEFIAGEGQYNGWVKSQGTGGDSYKMRWDNNFYVSPDITLAADTWYNFEFHLSLNTVTFYEEATQYNAGYANTPGRGTGRFEWGTTATANQETTYYDNLYVRKDVSAGEPQHGAWSPEESANRSMAWYNDCSDTAAFNGIGDHTWSRATSLEVTQGILSSTSGYIYASDYGTGTDAYGPLHYHTLDWPFQISQFLSLEAEIEIDSTAVNRRGEITVSLHDETNKTILSLSVHDRWVSQDDVTAFGTWKFSNYTSRVTPNSHPTFAANQSYHESIRIFQNTTGMYFDAPRIGSFKVVDLTYLKPHRMVNYISLHFQGVNDGFGTDICETIRVHDLKLTWNTTSIVQEPESFIWHDNCTETHNWIYDLDWDGWVPWGISSGTLQTTAGYLHASVDSDIGTGPFWYKALDTPANLTDLYEWNIDVQVTQPVESYKGPFAAILYDQNREPIVWFHVYEFDGGAYNLNLYIHYRFENGTYSTHSRFNITDPDWMGTLRISREWGQGLVATIPGNGTGLILSEANLLTDSHRQISYVGIQWRRGSGNYLEVKLHDISITTTTTGSLVGPSIALSSPSNSTVQSSGALVSFDVSDESGVSHVLASWDGNTNSSLSYPYAATQPSGDGQHILRIYSNDTLDIWSAEVYVFVIDDTDPVLDSPNDVSYSEGASGNTIVWNPTDIHPLSYYVEQNGTIMKSGSWNSTLETVTSSIDGLTLGVYNYTVVATDEAGNSISDMVLVTVYDGTAPSIDEPLDIVYEYGTTGHSVTWDPSDLHPEEYQSFLNGTPIISGLWNSSGETIDIGVDGLSIGVYNLTLVVTDIGGNKAVNMVWVTVEDTTLPVVDHPVDIEYSEGLTGNDIIWNPSDSHPLSHQILRNGSTVRSGGWDGSAISINIDGLTPGVYNYTLVVTDTSGNWQSDEVIVTVLDIDAPIIDHPVDLMYSEGGSGYQIIWDPSDSNPIGYQIFRNSTLVKSGSWNSSSETIMISVEGLDLGVYNYTILVTDIGGNTASDEVIVTVTDGTAPTIDHPADVYYDEGDTGNSITWDPSDSYPVSYSILRNSTEVKSGLWNSSSETITISIDGLALGAYNYTIVVTDVGGNWEVDEVDVTVTDGTPPTIDSPEDIFYGEGVAGSSITWTPDDLHPISYVVRRNGSIVKSGSWNSTGETITVVVDGLLIGVYNYTLVVLDVEGNSASDEVLVTVFDATFPTIIPVADMDVVEGSTGNVITWNPLDLNPSSYAVYRNTTLVKSGVWNSSSETITVTVDGLALGCYNFTLVVVDLDENNASDVVIVTIFDGTSPTIDSPADIEYDEGETGITISWYPDDLHPAGYTVYRNGTSVYSGAWNSSSEIIIISVEGLVYGTYNYTIVMMDVGGNTVSDEVVVRVVDGTSPTIDAPNDVEYNEGSIGNSITWDPVDAHPSEYVIYLNSAILRSGSWNVSSEFISVSLDGLPWGSHNFTLWVVDLDKNSATDSVFVTVSDETSPVVAGPSDIQVSEGSTDSIIWHPTDSNPESYEILRNGSLIKSGSWNSSSETITVSLEGLLPGVWNYTLVLTDIAGNVVVDTVFVTVLPAATTSQPQPWDASGMIAMIVSIGGGGLILIGLVGYFLIVKPRRKRDVAELSGLQATPASAAPVESDVAIQALRGGEFVGNRFRFKVKVLNKSPFVITDITVGLIAYPKDTLRIEGKPVKNIAKLEPNGFRSPTFDFLPTEDCVKGDIIASVSYVDSRGNAHSITTKPFTIRAVCDLLRPESISPEGFMLKLAALGHGEIMSRVEDWTPEEMHEKTLNILRDSNFFEVTSDLSQVGDGHVESKIKGWAKGIYTGNNLGVQVTITGRPGVKGATCKVRMSGEDEAMIMPAIDEISQKLGAWLCPKCSGALPVELVNELKAGKSVSCPFCSVTMDR